MSSSSLPAISLRNQKNGSDKVYNCEIVQAANSELYCLNYSHGATGSSLKGGSKTPSPVSYDKALSAFQKLVSSKVKGGYVSADDSVSGGGVVASAVEIGFLPQLLNAITPADVDSVLFRFVTVALQEKFDGERRMAALVGDKLMFANRRGCEVSLSSDVASDTKKLMIALRSELGFSSEDTLILDGEHMGKSFVIFDMVRFRDGGFSQETFKERAQWLGTLSNLANADSSGFIHVSIPLFTSSVREIEHFIGLHRVKKHEGVVIKKASSVYNSGKPASGGDALKLKFWESATVLVSEISQHKRSIRVSVNNDLGGGEALDIGAVSIPVNACIPFVGQLVEVRYLYYFSGGSLFQPTYKGLRTDLGLESACISQLKVKGE